jgi:beta-glucosidase
LFRAVFVLVFGLPAFAQTRPAQPVIGARAANVLSIDGLLFKDLNKNGKLDPYEDWRLAPEARANDLVSRMNLEEKAGLMVGPSLMPGPNGSLSEQSTY